MFKKVDCVRVQVPDIDKALTFYGEKLGLELVWRKGTDEAGLKMTDSDSEIVLIKEDLKQPELDLTVDSVRHFIEILEEAGGKVIVPPFDVSIGKCSVIEDPWKNRFVILDNTRGLLKVDGNRNVIQNFD